MLRHGNYIVNVASNISITFENPLSKFMMNSDGQIKYGHLKTDSGWTYGGYSASQTVHQKFIVKVFLKPFLETFLCTLKTSQVPAGYPLEAAGPIFCAGVTM